MINPTFVPIHRDMKESKHLRYVLKGGRGSGKSHFVALELVLELIQKPVTIICVRKVGNTLSESCFEEIKEAIASINAEAYFQLKRSPLMITYLPRGNSIYFRGADKPEKLKSLKVAKYPVTTLWIEELAEFKMEDEVSTIEKSILRGELEEGLKYKLIYSYNPPKRKQSWVNKKYESQFLADNTIVHHSTYLDNPHISGDFVDEADHLKKTRPLRYDWEFMGKPIGSGVVPFDNLIFEPITNAQIGNFDNLRQGLDWGYATDPLAMVRCHYDKTRRKVYIFDEIYGVKMSNRQASELIKKRGLDDVAIIADSAEPKSIDEVKGYGLKIRGAQKPPGSVEFGEKWLDDLEAIVIDPKRCPNTAREFESIDYQVDRYGDTIPRLEDKDNHCVTGDTLVDTEQGQKPIKDLVGTTGKVHAYNFDKGEKDLLSYSDVRKTRDKAPVYEVELEDGRKIKATSDHLVLTTGGWKMIKDLTSEDEIVDIFGQE